MREKLERIASTFLERLVIDAKSIPTCSTDAPAQVGSDYFLRLIDSDEQFILPHTQEVLLASISFKI